MDDIRHSIPVDPTRLFHQLSNDFRDKGYAYQTEKTYLQWIKRFIIFHNKRHPKDMGNLEVSSYLSHLANQRHCSPGIQRIALNALSYLYEKYMGVKLGQLDFAFARQNIRLPVVLSHHEVMQVLDKLEGKYRLMVELMYGAGLRQAELLSLRVKDLDFSMGTLIVRSGKGDKDRSTLLPSSLCERLQSQIAAVAKLHRRDLEDGFGSVYMPYALERKYPSGSRELGWQFLFPSSGIGKDPRSGVRRRHHQHPTEIYTHVLGRGAMGVISPMDS